MCCRYDKILFLIWYDDEELAIYFSEIPDIRNKEIHKQYMSKEQIMYAKQKPLYCKNKLIVILKDKIKNKIYKFEIPENYDYDGASIPRFCWRIVGSKENIEFKIASLIHDYLCENHQVIDFDRYFSSKVLERLLYVGDCSNFRRWLMFHCVDNYQKFCAWKKVV